MTEAFSSIRGQTWCLKRQRTAKRWMASARWPASWWCISPAMSLLTVSGILTAQIRTMAATEQMIKEIPHHWDAVSLSRVPRILTAQIGTIAATEQMIKKIPHRLHSKFNLYNSSKAWKWSLKPVLTIQTTCKLCVTTRHLVMYNHQNLSARAINIFHGEHQAQLQMRYRSGKRPMQFVMHQSLVTTETNRL